MNITCILQVNKITFISIFSCSKVPCWKLLLSCCLRSQPEWFSNQDLITNSKMWIYDSILDVDSSFLQLRLLNSWVESTYKSLGELIKSYTNSLNYSLFLFVCNGSSLITGFSQWSPRPWQLYHFLQLQIDKEDKFEGPVANNVVITVLGASHLESKRLERWRLECEWFS